MAYWILLTILYIDYGNADFMTKNADNYNGVIEASSFENYSLGPYIVQWDQYDKCRGPKSLNLTTFTTTLSKSDSDMYKGSLNVTFFDQTRVDEIKMSVFTMKDKVKTLLWNYIVSKPCQHYSLASFFETKLGVKNCVIKKGTYFMDLNLTELMINYLGNSFFYGEYIFKVVVISKKGNIVCLVFDPKFLKKPKK